MSKSAKPIEPEPFLPPGMTFPDILNAIEDEGYGDVEPKSEGEVFVRDCLDWLARWFASQGQVAVTQGVQPFMFVFDSAKLTSAMLPGASALPAFHTALEAQIGGHIYASASNLKRVFGVATALNTCPQLLNYLTEAGLANATAVVASPQGKFALVHVGGEDPEDAYRVPFERVSTKEFDFSQLDEYLGKFYEENLSTQDGYCDIWAKATKRQLKLYPERQIQKALQAFFNYAVLPRSAKIYREIQTHVGREDIRIIRAKADRSLEGAVMELKVLSPKKTEDKNLEWAKAGVDQAARYAVTDNTTAHRYVCCYDARPADKPIPAGVAYATEKLVIWRRYFLQTPGSARTTTGFDS